MGFFVPIRIKHSNEFYPELESRDGIEGFVQITFRISNTGEPEGFATVAHSSTGNFGFAAALAVTEFLVESKPVYNPFSQTNNRWEILVIFSPL